DSPPRRPADHSGGIDDPVASAALAVLLVHASLHAGAGVVGNGRRCLGLSLPFGWHPGISECGATRYRALGSWLRSGGVRATVSGHRGASYGKQAAVTSPLFGSRSSWRSAGIGLWHGPLAG